MSKESYNLPRWDMSVVYPGLTSPAYTQAMQSLVTEIRRLAELFDRLAIRQQPWAPLDPQTVTAFETILPTYNQVLEQAHTLRGYISGFTTTDSRDDLAQSEYSKFQNSAVQFVFLEKQLVAWLGAIDVEALILASLMAQDHAFFLRRAQQQARHLMSPAEEQLAVELSLSGGSAWSKLHGTYSSQLTVILEGEGETDELAMSSVRNYAYHPDREVRRWAFAEELAVWQRAAVPLAAALNGVKGEVITLARRRGWASPLEASLFDNGIDAQVLEAMLTAAQESYTHFRRYLRAKARALKLDRLAWYDLFAPITADGQVWSFAEAEEFILTHFTAFSPRLGQLARRAFRERWIDAEPRPGKRDGAFCMSLRAEESRILANFKSSYSGVSTLAHELGHAYHSAVLANRSPLQRAYPMTLAETASIFCETLVRKAALSQMDTQEQFTILESFLTSACQMVVDINSRFLFEQALFAARATRELSVQELNELMLDAQRQTYGDSLDPTQLHPYMWAAKAHYYRPSLSFYNYPYMFGLLFGLGLYAHYMDAPAAFRGRYDDLLSSTGMASATELAARYGIDIRSGAYWRASLDLIRDDISHFEALVATAESA